MNIKFRKAWAGVAGLALTASAVGIAVAVENPADWYDADNPSVADPDQQGDLLLYDATGTAITTGSTTAKPFAAYVASDTALPGATHATVYAYTADLSLAAGAYSGGQLSKTSPLVTNAPGSIDESKPVYAGAATDFSIADFAAAYPNDGDIYQLRLRGSSAAGGVGTAYAATYIQVTGSSWKVIDPPATTHSSTAATIPAKATYGTAFKVPVTVSAPPATATGVVQLRKGATVIASAQLGAGGKATITAPATKLPPGTHALRVVYLGSSVVTGSESAVRNVTVAKAKSTTTSALVKKTVKVGKKGKVKVTVKATGVVPTGTVTIYKGTKKLATAKLTAKNKGKITVTLPKLGKGAHKVYASYAGSAYTLTSKSKKVKLTVAK